MQVKNKRNVFVSSCKVDNDFISVLMRMQINYVNLDKFNADDLDFPIVCVCFIEI